MKSLNIVADSKIPFLKGVLEPFANVTYLSPKDIDADAVKEADALIVRTRTRCDESLLKGSNVKMIATATIGFDHIDRDYCLKNNIVWKNSPGCNADSVAQYVAGILALLHKEKGYKYQGKTIGIVGVGNVGKRVEKVCRNLGLNVLRCDPPRANNEGKEGFCDLKTIARESDIITFHTPLTKDGDYPTYHLAEKDFFNSLKRTPIIINAARGGVIDEEVMLEAYSNNIIGEMVIDCWENEPDIRPELLTKAFITTPHIAGYSADGKANATTMAVNNIAEFLGLTVDTSSVLPMSPDNHIIDYSSLLDSGKDIPINDKKLELGENEGQLAFDDVILASYNPHTDSDRLRNDPSSFEDQRGNYPLRREFKAYVIQNMPSGKYKNICAELGYTFNV